MWPTASSIKSSFRLACHASGFPGGFSSMLFSYKPGKFATQVIHGLIGFASVCGAILALVIVVFAVWSFRLGRAGLLEELLQLGVYGSVVWAFISTWGLNRSARELGARIPATFYTGPRPEDVDELRLWRWGRRFAAAFALIILFMATVALVMWFRNE